MRPVSQPAVTGHPSLLGRLLQLGAKPAHLRVLQPRVPGGLQEDPPELLPGDGQAALLQVARATRPPARRGGVQQRVERGQQPPQDGRRWTG